MVSILDIDNSLNVNNEDLERYYSIGNTFKLASIRNLGFIENKNVVRPFHDIWVDLIF